MDYEERCSGCIHFNFEQMWSGVEDDCLFFCQKGHHDHIGWYRPPCEDYEEG